MEGTEITPAQLRVGRAELQMNAYTDEMDLDRRMAVEVCAQFLEHVAVQLEGVDEGS